MTSAITSALAQANKNIDRLTRLQVHHLTAAGLLGLDEEGRFIVTPKAERKVVRGKTKALIAEWAPKVEAAVIALIKDENTAIRVDCVWKHLGRPDKAQFRSPILKNLQKMRDEGRLTQHKRGNSNFGIYYTAGPNWK